MLHRSLFVFDIETVPDTDAAPNLTGYTEPDIQGRRQAIETYHLDATDGKNAFPRQPFHKVVAISFLAAEIDRDGKHEAYYLKELRSGGKGAYDEETLLAGFFTYLERMRPRLVSYNGRTFDLPVLKFRAMKYGIQSPALFDKTNKWENYGARYALDWHCDLLEALTDFGAASRGLKLHEIAAILGIPGKFGIDGSQVAPLFDQGKLKDIQDYCETDVLTTYLVYLRYQLLAGQITLDGHNRAVADIVTLIEAEAAEKPHLGAFMDAWGEACDNRFLLEPQKL